MKPDEVKTVNAKGFAKYADETVEGIKSLVCKKQKN